jgi:hypothetical protein
MSPVGQIVGQRYHPKIGNVDRENRLGENTWGIPALRVYHDLFFFRQQKTDSQKAPLPFSNFPSPL